jgi:Putative abortive phage resistance protein AbiGi, antitoxin
MTCFAEIREEHLAIHISKYGYFGVGLPSHFLLDRGARPVIYLPLRSDDWRGPGGSTALQDIEQIYRGFLEHVVEPRRVPPSMSCNSSRTSSRSIRSSRTIIATTNYAKREWRYDISVNFALSDVRAVVVHPDFAGRCAADFRELGDRLRPSRCKQVCRRFQSALPRSTRTPAAMFCPVGIVSMRRAYARPLTASRRKCRADVQMQKALRVAGLSAALPLRLSSLCA